MSRTLIARCGAVLAVALLAACDDGFDLDLRDGLGGFDTSGAVRGATQPRPEPDGRGVISYPGYQVAVAQRGDTVNALAERLGLSGPELAAFNGIDPRAPLRAGEIVALPSRVAESGSVAIASLAGAAIDNAPADAARPPAEVQTSSLPQGPEPIRHKVERGETAFTIARLYDVPVQSLAEWNGLDADFNVREGQFLLIPVVTARAEPGGVNSPGTGSTLPVPPSSRTPVPAFDEPANAQVAAAEAEARAAPPAAIPDTAAFLTPITGTIIREYGGRNEGIDFGAPAGTAVKAAADGTVAAITQNTAGVPIIVIRHPNEIFTVYTQVDGLRVDRGDRVQRGDTIAEVRVGTPSFLHFEVRNGLQSVDPSDYLNL